MITIDISILQEIVRALAGHATHEETAFGTWLRQAFGCVPTHVIGTSGEHGGREHLKPGMQLKRFIVFSYERRDNRQLHGLHDVSATFDNLDDARAYCDTGDHNAHDVFDCAERRFVDMPHGGQRCTTRQHKRFVAFSYKRRDRGDGACDASASFDSHQEARAHHAKDHSFHCDVLDCGDENTPPHMVARHRAMVRPRRRHPVPISRQ